MAKAEASALSDGMFGAHAALAVCLFASRLWAPRNPAPRLPSSLVKPLKSRFADTLLKKVNPIESRGLASESRF
jgi:hypothetical protein